MSACLDHPVTVSRIEYVNAQNGSALGNNDGICVQPSSTGFLGAVASAELEPGELLDLHWGPRLQKWELQAAARDLLPDSRLRVCYRHRIKKSDFVRVYRRQGEKPSTYYKGLQVCGSVWCCPICSAKITERKRVELVAAMTDHRKAGGGVMLLTLTVPHKREHRAFEVADNLLEAFRLFGQGRNRWTGLVSRYVGSVRALEVTHGVNGWHPHLHVIVFTESALTDVQRFMLADCLYGHWESAVKRVGMASTSRAHGLRLDDGSEAGSYATKWGFAEELTKNHVKVARSEDSRTPWALLADYSQGDKAAGAHFQEFAEAFKGKSQLHWSRGLRDHFGLNAEKTDEQLAAETVEAQDLLMARISPASWSLIKRHELRGLVLEMLKRSDWSEVESLLDLYRSSA